MDRYARADVLRILRITARQLAAWEKAGLIAVSEDYSFFELLQLRKLRELSARRVRPGKIRESLQAMQRAVAGMENPLVESGTFVARRRLAFRHQGTAVEPVAGQFVMDFAPRTVVAAKVKPMRTAETAAEWFAKAIALEEDPVSQREAIEAYKKTLEFDPGHAAAHINLGTLYYNRQDYAQAEDHYRQAVETDPRYALAHFDLGNVLDETGRLQEAIQAYKQAIQLAPTYADAHYNLALAYEKLKQPRRALTHWRAYVRLDTSGPWSIHAQNQIRKTLAAEGLKVVYRRKKQ
ncbi:MAG TPA: tetratricopeptide repeat protein [Terriglobales bacterium]|nr:tetratricopeptide repeat protein [Terriglobales bacterium]